MVVTADGGYALAGSTSSVGAGSIDVWLVKVDSRGKLEWNQTYGGSIADYCDSMVISSDGGYALACITQTPTFGDGVFWLFEVDSYGNLGLNQTYGLSAHHSHTSLLITENESFILGGSTRDSLNYRDFWMAEIGEIDSGEEILFYFLVIILIISVLIGMLVYRRSRNPLLH